MALEYLGKVSDTDRFDICVTLLHVLSWVIRNFKNI